MCIPKNTQYFEAIIRNFSFLLNTLFNTDANLSDVEEESEANALKKVFETLFNTSVEVELPIRPGERTVVTVSQTLMKGFITAYMFRRGEKTFIIPAIYHDKKDPIINRLLILLERYKHKLNP